MANSGYALYHIDRCKGPCEGYQSYQEYHHNVNEARKILRGEIREVKQTLTEEMTSQPRTTL